MPRITVSHFASFLLTLLASTSLAQEETQTVVVTGPRWSVPSIPDNDSVAIDYSAANGSNSSYLPAPTPPSPNRVEVVAIRESTRKTLEWYFQKLTLTSEKWFELVMRVVERSPKWQAFLALPDSAPERLDKTAVSKAIRDAFLEQLPKLSAAEAAAVKAYRDEFKAHAVEGQSLKAQFPTAWDQYVNTIKKNAEGVGQFPSNLVEGTGALETLYTERSVGISLGDPSGVPLPTLAEGFAHIYTPTPYVQGAPGSLVPVRVAWMTNLLGAPSRVRVLESVNGQTPVVKTYGSAGALTASVIPGNYYKYELQHRDLFFKWRTKHTIVVNTIRGACSSPQITGTFDTESDPNARFWQGGAVNPIQKIVANGSTIQFTDWMGRTGVLSLSGGVSAFGNIQVSMVSGYALLGPSQLGIIDVTGQIYPLTFVGAVLRLDKDVVSFPRHYQALAPYTYATRVSGLGSQLRLDDAIGLSVGGVLPPPAVTLSCP